MISSEPGPPVLQLYPLKHLGQVSLEKLLVKVGNIWELEMLVLDCPVSSVLLVNLCAHLVLGHVMEMVF